MASKTKSIPFENSLQELEKIIAELEKGDQPLEDQLKAFERGIGLSRDCLKKLDEVERKVQILAEKESGSLEASEFSE